MRDAGEKINQEHSWKKAPRAGSHHVRSRQF